MDSMNTEPTIRHFVYISVVVFPILLFLFVVVVVVVVE